MTAVPAPCVGLVILNWNGFDDTTVCVSSVLEADPRPARIVVVDNASADGSGDALDGWIRERGDPCMTLVRSATNRGFAGGVNIGIADLARDPSISHFLLLNNDATVERDFFRELTRALGRAPNAGLLGVTIYHGRGREQVWYAGGRLPGVRSVAVHGHLVPPEDGPIPTEFVTGCTFLISRPAWTQLGPLPECYFIYFEDAEYCRRARDAGLPVLYAPKAVVHHAVAATVRGDGARALAEYRFSRGRALYARRNLRRWRKWAALAYLAITRLARLAIETVRGQPAVGLGLARGALDGVRAADGVVRA